MSLDEIDKLIDEEFDRFGFKVNDHFHPRKFKHYDLPDSISIISLRDKLMEHPNASEVWHRERIRSFIMREILKLGHARGVRSCRSKIGKFVNDFFDGDIF